MNSAPIPSNESSRLSSLRALGVLDTDPEPDFDALVNAASIVCGVPIALISLIDADRQWFKANTGLPGVTETPREWAFCAHAILQEGIFEVPDAKADPRFADNPLVTSAPDIRFYAGATLRLDDGSHAGTLCVIDRVPRSLNESQREVLRLLSVAAARAMESRRQGQLLAASEARFRTFTEASPVGVFATDAYGLCTYTNEAWQKIYGLSATGALGSGWSRTLHPDDREQVFAEWQRSADQKARFSMDFRVQHDNGEVRFVHAASRPVLNDSGEVLGHVGSVDDVTERKQAQEVIEAQSQRLSNIIRGTRVGTWEWHVPTGQTVFNERWADIIGYTLAELAPVSLDTWTRFAHPDDLVRSGEHLNRHFAGEVDYYECESRMRHKDGHWVWVLDRGRLASREADGSPGWMFGTHQDITQRKQAETALRRSEALLDRVARMAHVGSWRVDLTTGQPEWSAETCRIHDVPVGHRPTMEEALNFYAPEARPIITDIVTRGLQTGQPWDVELPFITATGRRIWVRAIGEAEFIDGKPVALVGGFQDVTDRHKREEKLRTDEARLRAIYDILPVAIAITDPEGHIIDCNPAIEHLTGMSKADILDRSQGSPKWATFREDGTPTPTEEFASVRALRQGVAVHDEVAQIVTDSRSAWVSVSAMPVQHTDFGVVVAYVDISQQKAQADALQAAKLQAEQASQFKSQFLANMSHEIRTPMNAILGMLKLLNTTPLQPRQLDYVEKTQGAANSLLGLLNDILDFSKVEAGKMTLDPQPFELDTLLRGLSVIFSASVGNKPVEVLFDIDPQAPKRMLGDSLRLQQILINLGGNAIKFTPQGEVVLRIKLDMLQNANDGSAPLAHLHFAVKDSGIGIAPENQTRIFAGFTQAETSTTRRFGGTGLGLSICKRLIEMMGGDMKLESAEGKGSTFSFTVPLPVLDAQPSDIELPAPELVPFLSPEGAQATRVMVVDDNPVAREVMLAMGASLGWHIDTADTGEGALQLMETSLARGEAYQAVFVDWLMPGLDGWQTSARLRTLLATPPENTEPTAFTPLIMMVTAHGREMLAQQTTEVQTLIDGYLVKPITASMMLDAVRDAKQPATAAKAGTVAVRRPLEGLRLLVVEDNAINQQVAEELLIGQGAMVDIADNGLRGFEAVQASLDTGKPYDAVLMDMQMPVMDGVTATQEIRNQLGVPDLPIIAMTANAMSSDREICLAAGMNDHVGKPFDLERLVSTLLQWAGGTKNVTPETAEASLSEPNPESLPCLDRVAALKRLGGDLNLLDRLSAQFLVSLPGSLETCARAQVAGQSKDAQGTLHSLKGVASTLGAYALAEVARQCEEAAIANRPMDIDALNTSADRTRQAMIDCGVAVPLTESANARAFPALDDAKRTMLRRLLPLLEQSDMAVFDVMDELLASDSGQHWQVLDIAVQSMEFDKAADWIRQALLR